MVYLNLHCMLCTAIKNFQYEFQTKRFFLKKWKMIAILLKIKRRLNSFQKMEFTEHTKWK